MSGTATVSVVLVWASVCLAFMRYRRWSGLLFPFPECDYANSSRLRRYPHHLINHYQQFNHISHRNTAIPFSSVLASAQPKPAAFGFLFCIIIVLVFSTAGWWNQGETTIDIWVAYVGVRATSTRYFSLSLVLSVKLGANKSRHIARRAVRFLAHTQSL